MLIVTDDDTMHIEGTARCAEDVTVVTLEEGKVFWAVWTIFSIIVEAKACVSLQAEEQRQRLYGGPPLAAKNRVEFEQS